MEWASALASHASLEDCVHDVAGQIRARLGDAPLDLLVVFVSSAFHDAYHEIPAWLERLLPARHLIGCSGGGVIGGAREVEYRPALSVTAARLPDVRLHLFHLHDDDLPDLDSGPDAWERCVGVPAASAPHFVLLADPHSFHIDNAILGFDYAYPRAVKLGGLASSSSGHGGNVLYCGRHAYRSGLVGVALHGNVTLDPVVSQGCRPVGKPLVVTRAEHNLVLALDQRRPLDVLHDLLSSSRPRDLALMRNALFLGIAMDASRQNVQAGDFLIRNVLGVDRDSGVIAVGSLVRPGQVVQFHVRDAETSAEDLRGVLDVYLRSRGEGACGALLFSCLGRGRHLYGVENHDSDLFRRTVGDVPLGGFFCSGEIGPVGTTAFVRTFVHGYTSCFGVFRAAQPL